MKLPKSDSVDKNTLIAQFSYWLGYSLLASVVTSSMVYYLLGSVIG